VNPDTAGEIIQKYITGRMQKKPPRNEPRHREMEVLKMLGEGYQNKEISSMLNISIKTVEKHRANIMGKLDLHNATSLTNYACNIGLVFQRGAQSSAGLKNKFFNAI
jgi:DNA-binding NarL/FixJ family response regulator